MAGSLHALAEVAARSYGVVTRAQALDLGIGEHQLRRWVSIGALQVVGPHAYRFPASGHGVRGELFALLADIGGEVWASGPTAAALLGFDGFVLRPPFHVTCRRGRNVRRAGHVVHTATVLEPIDRARVGGIPVTSGVRTLIGLARTETPRRLTESFDSGLRDGHFNESLVHRRIVALRSSGRFGIPRLLDVIEGSEIVRGGHSWLERRFLELVAASGLPAPATQQVLSRAGDRLVRVDFHFAATPVVVEVLGYRYHRTPSQMSTDVARLNALVLDGFEPFQFTYEQVVAGPDDVVSQVGAALARHHQAAA